MREIDTNEVFYTIDPDYRRFNGMKYQIVKQLHERGKNNSIFAVRLENGYLIRAFGDELNGFIRKHERDPIRMPVVWESMGFTEVSAEEASTLAEAKDVFEEKINEFSLPAGSYLEDSFQLSTEELSEISLHNHSFRDSNRQRNVATQWDSEVEGIFWLPRVDERKMREGICPVCGSCDLDYGAGELDGRSVVYPWMCIRCGSEGHEQYDLRFSGQMLQQREERCKCRKRNCGYYYWKNVIGIFCEENQK